MAYSAGETAFKNAYELNPITLVGGIASNMVGGALSITSIINAIAFNGALGSGSLAADNAFANFHPLPGATLIRNQVATYPMANLQVAANAIIADPLNIDMLMICTWKNVGDAFTKTSVMTSLQNTLAQHQQSGGLFNVATPSFFYTNVILVELVDVSGGETIQPQTHWHWRFLKPLVATADAAALQNTMMQNLSSGAPTDGANSGNAINVGNASNVQASGVSPAASGSPSAGVPAFVTNPYTALTS